MNLARNRLLTSAAGYRGNDAVVILLTDGATGETDAVLSAAAKAMQGVADVFAIGVGSLINTTQLNEIASAPASSHVFTIDFADLTNTSLLYELVGAAGCNIVELSTINPQLTTINSLTS